MKRAREEAAPAKAMVAKAGATADPPLSAEQQAVVDYVKNNPSVSVLITGPGGAGKSVVYRALVRAFKSGGNGRRGPRVAQTATTGVAAIDLDGTTVHSWGGLGVHMPHTEAEFEALVEEIKRKKAYRRWLTTDVLFVDEVSMLRADLFNLLDRLGRVLRGENDPKLEQQPFGGLRLCMFGDFFQLPPVPPGPRDPPPLPPYKPEGPTVVEILDDSGDERYEEPEIEDQEERPKLFAFEAEAWAALAPRVFELRRVWRQQEADFLAHLNAIRRGQLLPTTVAALKARVIGAEGLERPVPSATRLVTHIMPLNAEVDAINAQHLQKLTGICKTFEAQDYQRDAPLKGQADTWFKALRAPARLTLKVGAQVMLVRNYHEEGLVNGSVGRVVGFDAGKEGGWPYVQFPARGVIRADGQPEWPAVTRLMKPADWEKKEGMLGPIIASRTQVPLILAWAVSAHKSQGQTITCDVIASLGSDIFEYGQAYVILSRVQRLEQLYLEAFDPRCIRAHPRVLAQFPSQ